MKSTFKYVAAVIATATFFSTPTISQDNEIPVGIQPDEIEWFSPPPAFAQDTVGALLSGPPSVEGGLYTIRVKMKKGGMIQPHRHPDKRYITVLSGVLYAGRGTKIDEAFVTQYPAGSFFTIPAQYVHFTWAKEGEVVYQESGIGPTANELVTEE